MPTVVKKTTITMARKGSFQLYSEKLMQETTIKIIYDNCKENENLQEGWGFSALIETGHRKILFDTGNDRDAFFSNTEKMGINFREITDVVFSHKHDDHIAGCEEILGQLQENTRVYLPKGFPTKKVPKNLQFQKVRGLTEIDTNIFTLVLRGGFLLHEQSLILQEEKGLIVVTGCAHPGIVKILTSIQKKLKQPIYLVLGGFHLFRKNDHFVDRTVNKFQSLGVKKVAPCHCSGERTIGQFQNAFLQDFFKIGTGTILKII